MPRVEEVRLEPIREAFGRSRITVTEVARSMGKDREFVDRLLNNKPTYAWRTLKSGERKRYASFPRTCNEGTGLAFARAMGLDPYDLGF